MRKKLTALLLGCAVVFGLFAGMVGEAAAEVAWPTRPVQIVVPLGAGGDTDFFARTYAPFLEELLGQPFAVTNITGAAGTVGSTQVSMSAPDGYTVLFFHTGAMFTNNLLGTTDLNHHDFAMSNVAVYCENMVLVAGVQAGFADADDFLERARANPRGYNVATLITGFSFYVQRKMEIAGGFELNPVDVGGAGAMAASVLGGHTDLAVGHHANFLQYVENGDMIALMISSRERNPNFPDIPTVEELGLTGAATSRAYFFAFPQGTDEVILRRFADAVAEAQQRPEFIQASRESFGVEPFFVGTDETNDFLDAIWFEMERYRDYLLN